MFALTAGRHSPFKFSGEEKEQIELDVKGALRSMEAMRGIKESLGELFLDRGIMRTEQYEETMDALRQIKEQVIHTFAHNVRERSLWQDMWPFDD